MPFDYFVGVDFVVGFFTAFFVLELYEEEFDFLAEFFPFGFDFEISFFVVTGSFCLFSTFLVAFTINNALTETTRRLLNKFSMFKRLELFTASFFLLSFVRLSLVLKFC